MLERCAKVLEGGREEPLTAGRIEGVKDQNARYASKAMRVLAFAMKTLAPQADTAEEDVTFIGLQAMSAPPR